MRAFNHAFPEPSLIAGKIRLRLRDWFPMEAKVKAEILHGVIRKFGAGGSDITPKSGAGSSPLRTTAIVPGRKSESAFPSSPCPTSTAKTARSKIFRDPTACCWSSAAAPIGDHTAATSSSSCNSR
jgi:hypothetical protein